MERIMQLREKYGVHLKSGRYLSDDAGIPAGDEKFIRG